MCRSRSAGTVAEDTVRAAIGLGSNLGDRLAHLRRGLEGIARLGRLIAISSLYETAPMGGPAQDPYLNAVGLIETTRSPRDLLAALQEIESGAGRVRNERWGPRTLDLDLLVFDDLCLDEPDLEVPHPRAHQRRFVLAPLVEVWPDATLRSGPARDALADVRHQDITPVAMDWYPPGESGPEQPAIF